MPLDNNGQPFQFISITTLESTSDAIILPLSRPIGYDRRLVNPMPHPYGSIGEARPLDRLPINTAPRPGAPIRERHRNPMVEEPTHRRQNNQGGTPSGVEDPNAVGPHNTATSDDQSMTFAAVEQAEGTKMWKEEEPAITDDKTAATMMEPVVDNKPTPSQPYDGDDIVEHNEISSTLLEIASKSTIHVISKDTSTPRVRLPAKQSNKSTIPLRTTSPRCSIHAHSTTSSKTPCPGCRFVKSINTTGEALAATYEKQAAGIEHSAEYPNHSQTVCTDGFHILEAISDPSDCLPGMWRLANGRSWWFSRPQLEAEVDQSRRMWELKRGVEERRKLQG